LLFLGDRVVRVFLMFSGVPAWASVAASGPGWALPLDAAAALAGFTLWAPLAFFFAVFAEGVASTGLVAVLRVLPAGLTVGVPAPPWDSTSLQAISQCRASWPSGQPSDCQMS